ncbi:hypothetical protein [Candidatus Berkiella aquae]|uniref:Uncharacterized protein n=1 Tax=Candidatus Berkiella aquae TaxID=295108 RepID=A0A0Q9YL38_9GAMM|nr:hypothetical protein [Candidatus Berkiella aquae]MCS5710975.1 hypothetical protein [Candidatus Berkiella aquae]
MQFLMEQWQKPAFRYGLLATSAAIIGLSTLTGLSLMAILVASSGIGLFSSVIAEVFFYFKSIVDEAKGTIVELRETIQTVKESAKSFEKEKTFENFNNILIELTNTAKTLEANLEVDVKKGKKPLSETVQAMLTEFKDVAKALQKNLAIKKGKKPLVETVEEALTQFKDTAKSLDDNLKFDEKKGEMPLSKELGNTLAELKNTLEKLGKNLEINAEEGQQPLAQEITEAVSSINDGLAVAKTIFTPLSMLAKGSKFVGQKVGIIAPDKSKPNPSPSPTPSPCPTPSVTQKATVTEIEKAKPTTTTKKNANVTRTKQPQTRFKAKEPVLPNTEVEKQRAKKTM